MGRDETITAPFACLTVEIPLTDTGAMGPIDGATLAPFARVVVAAGATHSYRNGDAAGGELAVPELALVVPAGHIARLVISLSEHASIGRQTVKNENMYLHNHEIPSEAKQGLKRHLAFSNISRPYQPHTGQTPHTAYFTQLPPAEMTYPTLGLLPTQGLASGVQIKATTSELDF